MELTNGKKRIAIYLPTLNMGGTERVNLWLAQGLSKYFEVYLIVANAHGELQNQLPVGVIIVNINIKRTRFAFWSLYKALKNNRIDVLISSLYNVNVLSAVIRRFFPYNFSLICREVSTPSAFIKKYSLNYFLYAFSIKAADLIITVGKGVKEDIIEFIRYKKDNLHVIYSPIVLSSLPSTIEKKIFNSEKINLVTVARVIPSKGIHTLIKMLHTVNKEVSARLIIVGPETDSEYSKSLRILVNKLQLEEDVIFYGYSDDPILLIREADVFVFASYYEGLPGVIVQAMAEGKRIVSTDCKSGPKELLLEGKLGELVPVDDEEKFSAAVLKSIRNEPPVKELKEFASNFTLEKASSIYRDYILMLCNEKEN